MWAIVCQCLELEDLFTMAYLNSLWKRDMAAFSIKNTLMVHTPKHFTMLCKLLSRAESVRLHPKFKLDNSKIHIHLLHNIRYLDLWTNKYCGFNLAVVDTSLLQILRVDASNYLLKLKPSTSLQKLFLYWTNLSVNIVPREFFMRFPNLKMLHLYYIAIDYSIDWISKYYQLPFGCSIMITRYSNHMIHDRII